MMRPRRLAGLFALALAAACSKAEAPSPSAQPAASAATSEAPTLTPPVAEPTATATATTPIPSVETSQPSAVRPSTVPPPAPKPKPAYEPPADSRDEGRASTPAPNLGVKKVAVLANNHFTCTSSEKRDNVAAISETRGARISIIGQGPCPGEVHDWSAMVSEGKVEVHGTHGTESKCKCAGTGELVLRGLEPGTYDINVNGGFDRPIATRVVVSQ
jgi:hypothetical protein